MIVRILLMFMGALGIGYVLIIFGWGASVSLQVANFQDGKSDSLNITTPLTWFAEAKEYRELFSTESLNRNRAVDLEIETTIDALLAEGEPRPDPALFSLYATARAPGALIGECDLVLARLGTLCDVSDFEAKAETTGKVRIKGELVYLPAYDLGSPDGIENGGFVSLYERIGRGDPPPNSREGKLQALEMAEAQCDRLRAIYGNCVIERVRIEPDPLSEGAELRVDTTLQVYADQSQHNRKTITASLRSTDE
ncbi:MAG: hypothetical protein OIF48_16190 [Silicimonas sp.]|nr:hypothetical protein [Silicimonas sp.]